MPNLTEPNLTGREPNLTKAQNTVSVRRGVGLTARSVGWCLGNARHQAVGGSATPGCVQGVLVSPALRS